MEDDSNSESSVDLSGSSDDDDDSDDESSKNGAVATATQTGKNPAGSDDPAGDSLDGASDGIGLLEDVDIRNAIEDFDSSNWTLDQLEVSCQTLLEECYSSEDRRRRLLSAGMLLKLVETYPSALR